MAGAGAERVGSTPRSPQDELFANVLTTSGRRSRIRRRALGAQISLLAHVVGIALLVLVPLFLPSAPEQKDYIRALLYDPPPPPPPPPLFGSSLRPEPVKPEAPKNVVESPTHEFTAPVEIPHPTESRDTGVRLEDQFGSEIGSEFGDLFGMEGGIEGGVLGGVPGGVLGGVIGGTGMDPVRDYDSPPVLVRQTRPDFSGEAFRQKAEGTVLVEILIDTSGRVVRAQVLRSPNPLLDAAALQCVYEWIFRPAIKSGRPVASIAHAPVTFNLL